MSSTPEECLALAEKQVLIEYARTAQTLDSLATLAHNFSLAQPILLEKLRPMERKMGLVLTLFKASIWAVLVRREEMEEELERENEE